MPQPSERNRNFFLVTAADSICYDVHFVPSLEKIYRGLGYTDVAFDADNDAGQGTGDVEGFEGFFDFRGSGGRC